MTEDEAKTKTCCGPIPVLIGLLAVARPESSDIPHASCIGSTCMAWRWANPHNRDGTGSCGLAAQ